ncbi:ferric reductase-like transmembrane domain-containing protein [Desulfosporosinus fructosivorans]
MLTISHLTKGLYRKIILFSTLTVMLYIAISGIFSIPLNPTTINMATKAGGLSFYTIGALFLLSVLKATFFEFVNNSAVRSTGQTIFRFLHKFLGWVIFLLALYHSLFFMYYYIYPIEEISVLIIITGLCALICSVFVILSGKNAIFKNLNFESVYFKHVFASIVLILLIIIHLNFL